MNPPPAGKGKRDPQEILNRHKERAKGRVRKGEQERQERRPERPGQQQRPAT